MSNPRDSLPLEVWTGLIDQVSRFRPYVSLTGGEPTLYPRLPELIAYIKRQNLFCTMVTNGTLLPRITDVLEESPPDVLVVSLDGPADVHNDVRGQPRTFERAAEGLAKVQDIKRRHRRHKPLIAINCSITAFNQTHLEQAVDIAVSLGAEGLNFQQQWAFTEGMVAEHNRLYGHEHNIAYEKLGGMDMPPVDTEALVATVARIRARARRSDCGTYVGFYPDLDATELRQWYSDAHNWVQRRTPACAWTSTYIWPTGEVEACPGVMAGNIAEQPFAEIWNGAAFRGLRQRLSRDTAFPICARCCFFCRTE